MPTISQGTVSGAEALDFGSNFRTAIGTTSGNLPDTLALVQASEEPTLSAQATFTTTQSLSGTARGILYAFESNQETSSAPPVTNPTYKALISQNNGVDEYLVVVRPYTDQVVQSQQLQTTFNIRVNYVF